MRARNLILALVVSTAFLDSPWHASPGFAAETIGADAFLASPAAAAFKQGQFEQALEGFEALLADYPGDPVILRYIGIALDRLERYQEAVEAFQKGLERAPDNAVLNFFLGISSFKLRDVDGAVAAFRNVVAVAADTAYGKRAHEYLQAIERQRASKQRPGAPRRWDLFAQIGSQYDSNVTASPDFADGDRNSLRFYESLSGGYDIFRGGPWRLRAEASTYHSQHIDRPLDDLDLNAFNGAIVLSYSDTIFGRPITPSLRYGWGGVMVGGNMFNDTHSLQTSISVNPTDNTLTRLSHEFSVDSFRERGFDPDISSRDAWANTLGLTQYLFFDRGRHYVWGGYRFRLNDADGVNFDYHTHTGQAGVSVALPYRFRLDANGEYSYQLYDHFVTPFARRAARMTYSAALSRPLWDGLNLSLGYNFTDEDSNFSVLEYDRDLLTLSMGYRF